ncbi:MAG: hypothetical protein ACREQL_11005 [Candidatus Binatia bacterium]
MTFRPTLLVVVALMLLPAGAQPDEIGPAMPSTPAAIEAAAPSVPFVVRQQDADAILGRAVPRSDAKPPPAPRSLTVEITLDPAPVVNQTQRFVFVDQTDRSEPHVRSMPERQAAVEAVRQSLRLPGGR